MQKPEEQLKELSQPKNKKIRQRQSEENRYSIPRAAGETNAQVNVTTLINPRTDRRKRETDRPHVIMCKNETKHMHATTNKQTKKQLDCHQDQQTK